MLPFALILASFIISTHLSLPSHELAIALTGVVPKEASIIGKAAITPASLKARISDMAITAHRYPFTISDAETQHFLDQMGIKKLLSNDPILRSLINDEYAPFYKNSITPEQMRENSGHFKDTLVPLMILKRLKLKHLFGSQGSLSSSQIDKIFKFARINPDEFLEVFHDFNGRFLKYFGSQMLDAFQIYKQAITERWSLLEISTNVQSLVSWGETAEFLILEMKFAIQNRDFVSLLFAVIQPPEKLLSMIRQRSKPEYLAKFVHDWIPNVDRLDQELVYQLIKKLNHDQQSKIDRYYYGLKATEKEELGNNIDQKFRILTEKFTKKYGESGSLLSTHLKEMMKFKLSLVQNVEEFVHPMPQTRKYLEARRLRHRRDKLKLAALVAGAGVGTAGYIGLQILSHPKELP